MLANPEQQDYDFLLRIKAETLNAHKSVEKGFKIFDANLSIDDYRTWLARIYGFYAPFEILVEPWLPELAAIDWHSRRKTGLLVRDLQNLGLATERINDLAHCQELPNISNFASLLGAIYVLEGSTLGGQFIAQHLHKKLGLQADNGAGFFLPYGDKVRDRWQTFQGFLVLNAGSPELSQQIIDSANHTFAKFEHWLLALS